MCWRCFSPMTVTSAPVSILRWSNPVLVFNSTFQSSVDTMLSYSSMLPKNNALICSLWSFNSDMVFFGHTKQPAKWLGCLQALQRFPHAGQLSCPKGCVRRHNLQLLGERSSFMLPLCARCKQCTNIKSVKYFDPTRSAMFS